MGIKKGLSNSWKAWGQWNNIKELLDLFGWKDWLRDQVLSTALLFVGGGLVGMFAGAITIGSPAGVVLYALIVGFLVSSIALIVSFARGLRRIQSDKLSVTVDGDIFHSPTVTATKPKRPLPIALSIESLGSYMRTDPRVGRLDEAIAKIGRKKIDAMETVAFAAFPSLKDFGVANVAEVDAMLEEREEIVLHSATHWTFKGDVLMGWCVLELCKVLNAERGKDDYTKKIVAAYMAAKNTVSIPSANPLSIATATLDISASDSTSILFNYYDTVCAVTVRNIGDTDLKGEGLMQIEQISARPEGLPIPFVLRTENQIREKRTGRFTLSAKQPKTVPIMFRLDDDWCFFDSQENYYSFEPRPLQIIIGVYGGEKTRRVLVSMEPVADHFRPRFTVETVSLDYSLPGIDK